MVRVPSGEAAVSSPLRPGRMLASCEEVEQARSELELLGDPVDRERVADLDVGQRHEVGLEVQRPGNRVAVRACRRAAEHAVHRLLDGVADDVLPLAGLVMSVGPRKPEHVGEEPLGETVTAHDQLRERLALKCEANGAIGRDQAFGFEPADHLADCRPADLQALGDSGLDDGDVVLVELEDALAVLLEGRMVLSGALACATG